MPFRSHTPVKKPVVKTTPEQRVRNAKRVATQAISTAAEIASDSRQNRSTRSRTSYKLKADALDRVARILAGKE